MYRQICPTPLGTLLLRSDGAALVGASFDEAPGLSEPDGVTALASRQLSAYFAGTRRRFDVPLRLSGSPFAQAVCAALLQVPFGQTVTYAQLAAAAGHPGAARAVGTVMRKNPLVIFVPCHRVVAAHGLGGYACGLARKRLLLSLEGAAPAENPAIR